MDEAPHSRRPSLARLVCARRGDHVRDAPSDGRYDGRTAETLLLRAPDYVLWVLRTSPTVVLPGVPATLWQPSTPVRWNAPAKPAALTRAGGGPGRAHELYFFCGDCAGRFG